MEAGARLVVLSGSGVALVCYCPLSVTSFSLKISKVELDSFVSSVLGFFCCLFYGGQ